MSRYELGETVYRFLWSYERVHEVCELCGGRGRFKVGTERTADVRCPECCGDGMHYYQRFTSYTVEQLTVGDIAERRSTVPHLGPNGDQLHEVRYMCEETGIGSGSVLHECSLYPSSLAAEEAAIAAGHRPRGTRPEPVGERA